MAKQKILFNGIPFTGCDVTILVSSGQRPEVIDEINYFKFNAQQDAIPLYNYNSNTLSAIARSRSIVTGMFSINFISPNYLSNILAGIANEKVITPDPKATSRFDIMKSIRDRISSGENIEALSREAEAAFDKMLPNTTAPSLLDTYQKPGLSFSVTFSPGTYSTVPSVYQPTNSAYRYIIDSVTITSFGQEFQPSGEPLQEIYSFIAKELRPFQGAN